MEKERQTRRARGKNFGTLIALTNNREDERFSKIYRRCSTYQIAAIRELLVSFPEKRRGRTTRLFRTPPSILKVRATRSFGIRQCARERLIPRPV